MCQDLKLSLVDQTKMITAASELSRNTLIHGGGGTHALGVRRAQRPARAATASSRTRARASPTSALALTDGWTSGNGMGLGLPGSKRLVNDFDIDSAPGAGTRVSITKWK